MMQLEQTTKRRAIEKTVIRAVVIVLAALTGLSMLVAMMPGTDKWEGGRLVSSELAGGYGYVAFAIAALLPAIAVWKLPRPMMLVAWSAFLWVLGTIVFIATFHLDFGFGDIEYVHHAGHYMFIALVPLLAIVTLCVMPMVAAIYATVTKIIDVRRLGRYERSLQPAPLPMARVIA